MTTNCCHPPEPSKKTTPSCCGGGGGHDDHGHDHAQGAAKADWMILLCTPLIVLPYLFITFAPPSWMPGNAHAMTYLHSIHEFVNSTWWGVLVGIFFLAVMSRIPREFVMAVLGNKKGASGIFRAILAGTLLDICSHGILMVGTKLYQRGASIGQTMAFLIASPWNSISLTFILISMIGIKLTLTFLLLSALVAFISGMIFDALADRKVLPQNPNSFDLPEDFRFFSDAKKSLKATQWKTAFFKDMAMDGIRDSRIVVRWLLLGIILASVLRVFFDPQSFQEWFGPSVMGMMATIFFATILEVCSEGSSPIAADLVTRAQAPGNAFAFLMAGVATDYTEVMVMKETTSSWKVALFLPLITLPQVIILGILINLYG